MLELQTFLPNTSEPCSEEKNHTVYFQLHVLDTDCDDWDLAQSKQALLNAHRSIVGVLTVQCEECSQISDTLQFAVEPVCVYQRAVFRGAITRDAQYILCALNTWHQSKPTLSLGNNLHLVDDCNLKIDSLNSTSIRCYDEDITTAFEVEAQLSPTVTPVIMFGIVLAASAGVVVALFALMGILK
jgi:hypothetical protein